MNELIQKLIEIGNIESQIDLLLRESFDPVKVKVRQEKRDRLLKEAFIMLGQKFYRNAKWEPTDHIRKILDDHSRNTLAAEIRDFLDKHALKSAQEPDKYSSPDANLMSSAANFIEQGLKVLHCWSEWGSGGYTPYADDKAKEWHDSLLRRIREYQ